MILRTKTYINPCQNTLSSLSSKTMLSLLGQEKGPNRKRKGTGKKKRVYLWSADFLNKWLWLRYRQGYRYFRLLHARVLGKTASYVDFMSNDRYNSWASSIATQCFWRTFQTQENSPLQTVVCQSFDIPVMFCFIFIFFSVKFHAARILSFCHLHFYPTFPYR